MNECVICHHPLKNKAKLHLKQIRLVQCDRCQSWISLPRPTVNDQIAIHDDAEYFEHPYFELRRHAQQAIDRRCRQVFSRLAAGIDLNILRNDRLLDVGCDTGSFLESAARQFGIVPVGVDVSSWTVQEAQKQGIEAYATALETAPTHLSQFSVITAIDLIEHVVDPASLLKQIFLRLRPGGVTYLETPNIQSSIYQLGSLLSGLTGGRPASVFERLFPLQHIQYFTPNSFRTLVEACGFEIVQLELRPLPFSDLATSTPIRAGLTALQVFDRLTHNEILICGLLRKPI
ncbi:MAG TPA: class I SAM-dependent methyltransferase [Microcoleaceae cyanobacterium]